MIPVIFRIDNSGVFALLPTIPADVAGRYVTSYQHIGQHCGADYSQCVRYSQPATPAQFAPLLAELQTIGYSLRVARRQSPAMRRECRRQCEN